MQPTALVIPGRAGIITRGMPSSAARAAACMGPAPPKANSTKSRGSWPRASVAMRIAPAMRSLAIRMTAAAAASASRSKDAPKVSAKTLRTSSGATGVSTASSLSGSSRPRDQVGIGERRPPAAPAVADRPRLGPRALRPDLEQPGFVDPRDAATAGAHRVHVYHGHVDRHAVLQLHLGRHRRHAVEHQAYVGAGAAGIEGDEIPGAGGAADGGGGHHARGGARKHGVDGLRRCRAGRDAAAVALDHQKLAPVAARPELALKPVEVAVQQRLDAGVHRCGDAALELSELGEDGVPRRDVALRPALAGNRHRALLMRRVLVAVQEVDHEGVAACGAQAFHRIAAPPPRPAASAPRRRRPCAPAPRCEARAG